jgi:hypothetical protein
MKDNIPDILNELINHVINKTEATNRLHKLRIKSVSPPSEEECLNVAYSMSKIGTFEVQQSENKEDKEQVTLYSFTNEELLQLIRYCTDFE